MGESNEKKSKKEDSLLKKLQIAFSIFGSLAAIAFGISSCQISKSANELSAQKNAVDFFVYEEKDDKIRVTSTDGRATNINTMVYYNFSISGTEHDGIYKVLDAEYYLREKNKEWAFPHTNYDHRKISSEIDGASVISNKIVEITYTDCDSNFKKKYYIEKLDKNDLDKETLEKYTETNIWPKIYVSSDENDTRFSKKILATQKTSTFSDINISKSKKEKLLITNILKLIETYKTK